MPKNPEGPTDEGIATSEEKPKRLSDLPLEAEHIKGGPITAAEQALLDSLSGGRKASDWSITREGVLTVDGHVIDRDKEDWVFELDGTGPRTGN